MSKSEEPIHRSITGIYDNTDQDEGDQLSPLQAVKKKPLVSFIIFVASEIISFSLSIH